MRQLPKQPTHPQLLVGNETSDDAGVFQITEDIALIQTVDYFTPVVDDPYMFGQIAAANALSDVYAMGGTPKTALNIVGYPIKKLGSSILADILRGASDKVVEAGAVTVGGHSIDDAEPKFGLAVTGIVSPQKIWKNVGAKPGDVLVLTKPLGVGILTTGIKRNVVTNAQQEAVTQTMATLNKESAETLFPYTPHAVTDVTGFGLLGHASEMAEGSGVSINITFSSVPFLDGTLELADQGIVPGGSKSNHSWLQEKVTYDESLSLSKQLAICDSITSGGLLISMSPGEAQSYVQALQEKGRTAYIIGQVVEKQHTLITVNK